MSTYNKELLDYYSHIEKKLIDLGFKEDVIKLAINDNNLHILQKSLLQEQVKCTSCKLSCSNKIYGSGNTDSPIMVVGESANSDDVGLPFTGLTGTVLVMMLNKLGIYRARVYMTNTIRCPIQAIQQTTKEIEACRIFLIREILIVQPKIIIGLGNSSIYALTREQKEISEIRGNILDFKEQTTGYECKTIFTWNPSDAIKNKGYKLDMWNDISLAVKYAKEVTNFDFNKRPYSL